MTHWDIKLENGKTPRELVSELGKTHSDKQIAIELSKLGHETTDNAVRSVRRKLHIVKPLDNTQEKDAQVIKGNTWQISLNRTPIGTFEELIKAYNIDTLLWEVTEFKVSRYEVVHGVQATGNSKLWEREDNDWTTEQLHSIRATFKKRPNVEFAQSEIALLKESALKFSKKPIIIKRVKKPTDNLLEMCLPDMHFGKVGWHAQTGYEDYDVAIARGIFNEAIPALLSRVEPYRFGSLLFVVGNDVVQTDNSENATYSGTQVDSDTRYHRTFKIVREVMVSTIEMLRSVAPVQVIVVPGNHDRMTAWHLGDSLECYFHLYKDVEINNDPISRKYIRWGSCLLMFTHGDKGKKLDYPKVMASERPEDWGQTLYREIHTGDKHQTKVEETHGVRVRILPSLTGTDTWHSENMFVGNQRCAEAFVWNKNDGLLGTAIYTYKGK